VIDEVPTGHHHGHPQAHGGSQLARCILLTTWFQFNLDQLAIFFVTLSLVASHHTRLVSCRKGGSVLQAKTRKVAGKFLLRVCTSAYIDTTYWNLDY
jgi:hypothetical protein